MGSQPELALYSYWRSSSSHRVRIALELKGLSYQYVPVNLLAEEHTAAVYRAHSPTGYLPSLLIDGVAYTESVAILELLDERFPKPALLPSEPHGRARVRALVEIINSGIQPLHNLNVTLFLSKDEEVQRGWRQHFIGRGLASLEAALEANAREGQNGPFAYGKTPTLADVLLVPQLFSARRFKVDLSPFPRVVRAFEAASQLDAFQRAAPERQPDAVSS